MRRLAAIVRAIFALVLALSCARSVALAVTPIDPDAPVSLAVEFEMNGTHIPKGRFDLYRVGTMDAGGAVSLLPEHASKYSLTNSTSRKGWARLAREMADDFQARNAEPLEIVYTDADGLARFGASHALEQGVYLVVGHDTKLGSETYSSLPYLISLPLWDDETKSWEYDVLSQPKVSKRGEGEPSPTPTPTPTPKPTPSPHGGGTSTKTRTPSWLPKTGEELTYWLAYLVIGCALVEIGLTIKRWRQEP